MRKDVDYILAPRMEHLQGPLSKRSLSDERDTHRLKPPRRWSPLDLR